MGAETPGNRESQAKPTLDSLAKKYDIAAINAKKVDERSALDKKLLDLARNSLPDKEQLNWPDKSGGPPYTVKPADVAGGILAIIAREYPASELNTSYFMQLAYAQLLKEVGPSVNTIEEGDVLFMFDGRLYLNRREGSTLKGFDAHLFPWGKADSAEAVGTRGGELDVDNYNTQGDTIATPAAIETVNTMLAQRKEVSNKSPEEVSNKFPVEVITNKMIPLLRQHFPGKQLAFELEEHENKFGFSDCSFFVEGKEVATVGYMNGHYYPMSPDGFHNNGNGTIGYALEQSALDYYNQAIWDSIKAHPFPIDKGEHNGEPFYVDEKSGDIMRNIDWAPDSLIGYDPPVKPQGSSKLVRNTNAVQWLNERWESNNRNR